MKITVEDFTPLGTLVKAYELDPAKHYIFIFDGKKFDRGLAGHLFAKVREDHPEMCIHVIGTQAPKAIEVAETTLADKLADVQRRWLDSPPQIENTQDFITELIPLLNRAITALRGDHGSL